MRRWKNLGVFDSPKGQVPHSYCPPGVTKCCFVLIPFSNTQLMEPTVQIEFGEHFATSGSCNEVCGHLGWVAITQCLTIQLSIINTQPQFPILFGREQHWVAIQALAATDCTCSLEDCNLSVQIWQVLWRHRVWPISLWTCSFHFCNIQIPMSVWCQWRHFVGLKNCGFIPSQDPHDGILFL